MQDSHSYPTVVKILHWGVVLLVGGQFLLGWTMPGVRGATNVAALVSYHFSFGLLIVPLALTLLGIRIVTKAPAFPVGMPRWQGISARVMHYTLYALLLLVPLAGWAYASVHGIPVALFGIASVPALFSADSSFGLLFGESHSFLASLLGLLILGHAGAALWHYFVDRDGVMEEMLFTRRKESGTF